MLTPNTLCRIPISCLITFSLPLPLSLLMSRIISKKKKKIANLLNDSRCTALHSAKPATASTTLAALPRLDPGPLVSSGVPTRPFSSLSFSSRWAYAQIPLSTFVAGKALANRLEVGAAPTTVAESKKSIRKSFSMAKHNISLTAFFLTRHVC